MGITVVPRLGRQACTMRKQSHRANHVMDEMNIYHLVGGCLPL